MKSLLLLTTVAALAILPPAFAGDDGHGHEENTHAVSEATHDDHGDENSEHGDHDAEDSKHDDHDAEDSEHDDHDDEDSKHDDHDDEEDGEDSEHGHGHEEEEDGGHEEGGAAEVDLSPENMEAAGILVEPLTLQNLEDEVKAPGEVKLNSYLSSKVTPRIEAQIVSRQAKLGDIVKKGQPLVTLSSVEMAEAIGELLVAHKEWQRVKQLGASAVSAKRYSEAKIADQQALAKVMAYGMTEAQVKVLHEKGSGGSPGTFQLVAPQGGTIVSDEFIEGELIEPGRVLFNIVNEDSLWVETRLSPELSKSVEVGAGARIHVPGNGWLQGSVIQKHHLLDEETRTIGVRIAVDNEEDRLHPGMYVDTRIQSGNGEKYLAVPTASVLRSPDGDWVVFVESENRAGEFKPVEIKALNTIEDYTVIKGLPEGTRLVTEGAFFVQSELAKSGFEVHNH